MPIPDSPDDLAEFLDIFYESTLVNFLSLGTQVFQSVVGDHPPFRTVSATFGDSLNFFTENHNNELAQCDVAWWTRLCLAQSPCKTVHYGRGFIGGMYCGIHTHIVSVHAYVISPFADGRL